MKELAVLSGSFLEKQSYGTNEKLGEVALVVSEAGDYRR